MAKVNFDKFASSQDLPKSRQLKILVVDDHQLILTGTLNVLRQQYPDAEIINAQTAQDTTEQIAFSQFDLVVMDLSIPEKLGMTAQTDTGINLLQELLNNYPNLNFLVQSSYVKALVRIKHEIDNHQGGFAIADKGLSEQEMLTRVNLTLQGATHTKDIKTGLELKPEWLEVLRLGFEEGLTDKLISERMYKSERAVRTYWTKIQDVLGVYPEDCKKGGKNIRIQTEIRAKEEGLID
ncbi:response regulator transcription factor [Desmonostoc muscorum LEGE 12446]|uniref:Response regulator transcription factor n=1 Tax=Desmonostoc muscorum LEGE 12446 TaxID=1828758 RepID=A0A8J7DGK5_DESMC|nr:response regulator transcription factor [Desmonostoc muscorum]MCF2150806.1 response regulator transcription factor [Desmonostoc muscorum LEGE 12446]